MQGTVTMFKPERGYGFILGENGESYFVHHTSIFMPGFRYLERGQEVVFEESNKADKRGKVAAKVRPVQKGDI